MAQKFREGLAKIMPQSMAIFAVLALAFGIWQLMPVKEVHAGNNVVTSITLLDTDANGKMDRARILIDNDGAVTGWMFNSGEGWSVTDNGVAVSITAAGYDTDLDDSPDSTSTNADPQRIILGLDETNITANDTVNTDLEIIYTQQAVNHGTEYNDSANTQTVAITTGDGGAPAIAEADGANPLFLSATYQDSDSGKNVDRVVYVFTEPLTPAQITAADWGFTVTGDVGMGGDFVIGDCSGSGTTTITCTDAANANITSTANRTGKQTAGGAEPTMSYTNNTADLADPTGNQVATTTVAMTDGAAAMILTRVTKDTDSVTGASGTVDGTMNGILATWTEIMDASTAVAADFAITLNNGTGLTETYGDTTDDTTLFFGVTDSTASDTSNLLKLAITGVITDVAGVTAATSATTAATDGAAPYLISATYSDSDSGANVDRVAFLFTEVTTWTTITAADWAFTTAGDVNLASDFQIGDCSGSGTLATITCTDAANAHITSTANRTGKQTAGGSEPAFTYTNNTNDINDGTNNTPTFGPITLTDGAAAMIVTRVTKDTDSVSGAAGTVDGTMNGILATWTEMMDASTAVAGDFAITLNNGTGLTETYGDTTDDTTLFFGVTDSTAGDTSNLLKLAITGVISDVAGVTAATSATTAATDGCAPVIKTVAIYDADTTPDGKIDKIIFTWTENVGTDDGAAPVAGDMPTTLLPDGTTAVYTAATISDPAGAAATVEVTGITGQTTINTASGSTAISGDLSAKWADGSANAPHSAGGTANETVSDAASPVVVSVSPADAASSVTRTDDIVITFSEAMSTTFAEDTQYDVTPDPGSFTAAWTSGNTVVTLSHATQLGCGTTITVTTAEASINASAGSPTVLVTTGPSDGDWTFDTASCSTSPGGGGGGGAAASTTPNVILTDLTDQTGGNTTTVRWRTSGNGLDTVGLYYSTNAGATYTQIAYNINKSEGEYDWTVPNIDADSVIVKIIGYDTGKANLDSDTSAVFSITASGGGAATEEEETVTAPAGTTTDEEGRTVAETSGSTGASPVTGEMEAISTVATGEYIRSYSFNTIYYIDENGERRPFWDTNSFFTYTNSFDNVVWVTDATLPTMTLGAPMLPQPGVVLVKIQSDPKVYAIDTGNVLRWVPDEATAAALYSTAWADYIIDLEPTTFARFSVGDDMTTGDTVNLDQMKTRVGLAELAQ